MAFIWAVAMRFTIRNGTFETGDHAIALNGHDYAVGNPELGWIEDGVIENMHDLPNPKRQTGYFCRMLAGAWIDWQSGMEVQQSDTVVSEGRLYRVQANPDGTLYRSVTRPTHQTGRMVLDGIPWGVVHAVTYTAGVAMRSSATSFLARLVLPSRFISTTSTAGRTIRVLRFPCRRIFSWKMSVCCMIRQGIYRRSGRRLTV
jgi:hypothetical protein